MTWRLLKRTDPAYFTGSSQDINSSHRNPATNAYRSFLEDAANQNYRQQAPMVVRLRGAASPGDIRMGPPETARH